MSVSTTPFESDEVEILSIGGINPMSAGHSLYFSGQPIAFKTYPEHKTAADSASSLPAVTFTR
jgi:hypothetical protein